MTQQIDTQEQTFCSLLYDALIAFYRNPVNQQEYDKWLNDKVKGKEYDGN